MNEQEKKLFRTRGLMIETVPPSDITEDDIYCRLCQCYVRRRDLKIWTGNDMRHYLCPGCDDDLLEPEIME